MVVSFLATFIFRNEYPALPYTKFLMAKPVQPYSNANHVTCGLHATRFVH